MKPARPLRRRVWLATVMLALFLLPVLALLPFGVLWLWQQGLLLHWLGAAGVLGLGGHLLLRRLQPPGVAADTRKPEAAAPPDPGWSPRDHAAWTTVQEVAAAADPELIGDRDALLRLARETVERVAQHYHPGERDPIWNFTVPEALLLCERVSARLREVLLASVPGVHIVRVGQAVRLWEYRPLAMKGARAMKYIGRVWRVARTIDPVAAVVAEARDRVMRAAMGEAGAWLRRRGVQIWVEEVGSTAIELYSGRLRADARELRELAVDDGAGLQGGEGVLPGALRLLVAGQAKAGKSSLVNRLLGEVAAGVDALPLTGAQSGYGLNRPGMPELQLIDTPGLGPEMDAAALARQAYDCDILVWVVAAHRADRQPDRAALDALRAHFAAHPERSLPPLLLAVSHIDRLSPVREWAPPYDLEQRPGVAKARAIRGALLAIAEDLRVPREDLVPVRLDSGSAAYNVDLLWALLEERLERAGHSRLQRLHLKAGARDWRRVLGQARNAGRLLTRLVRQNPATEGHGNHGR